MTWRKSLLVPIILLLVTIALTTLLIGYGISLSNLRDSLEAREKDKVSGVHSVIQSLIGTEVARLRIIATLLKRDPRFLQAIASSSGGKGNAALREIMDQLHEGLGMDILAVTDRRGINLYSPGQGEAQQDLGGIWGMDEALDGHEMVASDRGSKGFVIRLISPVFRGKELLGTIIAGIGVDDAFAGRLAGELGSRIFFGSAAGIVAASEPPRESYKIDDDLVKHTLLDKKTTIGMNPREKVMRLYAPISVVDTHFCLVVDSDVSRMYLNLEKSRSRLLLVSAMVLLILTLLGSLLAYWFTRPLRRLRSKAEGMVREYAPAEKEARYQGNEVETLIAAFERMESAVREHMGAATKANAELEKAHGELERRVQERTAELVKVRDAAEAANRAKSQFLANMSHEIRTPMNGVLGFLELLREEPLDGQQREYVDMALTSGEALLQLINDLLDFSKIEAGKLELVAAEFDLHQLVREVVDFFGKQAQGKGIEMTGHIDAGTPSVLRGDRLRLRQILVNLLGNAVKFTERGGVAMQLSVAEQGVNTILLRFEVRDTGVGISPEALSRIFQVFSQADGSTTRRFGGTGLGLAIAKQLVQMMDGKIGVRSVPGSGSTFWFTVRLDRPDLLAAQAPLPLTAEEAEIDAATGSGAAPSGKGRFSTFRILLVEDNLVNQAVTRAMLNHLGCRADVAGNGREALEALAGEAYDLILMDCQMPEMDGYEATRAIREQEGSGGRRIPIVALTAHAMEGDRQNCLDAGMDDYLSKPYKPEELDALLTRWLIPA